MNIAQKNFLLLPASRSPLPYVSPFAKIVNPNWSIRVREKEIKIELIPLSVFCLSEHWSVAAPFCKS
jgi:hypothetical protein